MYFTLSSFLFFTHYLILVRSIKNDLTNYRQYIETSQIGDVESEDIRLLKLKGRAIEAMSYQDYLDGSAIEETILLLLL